MNAWLTTPILVLTSALLVACGGGGGGSSSPDAGNSDNTTSPETVAPPQLTLPQLNQLYVDHPVGIAIANSGGALASCDVSPQLPSGLTLKQEDNQCVISGQTTALYNQSHLVSGRNASGVSQVSLTLDIQMLPQPPALEGPDQLAVEIGKPVNLMLSNRQDQAERCDVTPLLPQGIVIQPRDGGCLITGRGEYSITENFAITAINAAGSDQHLLQITMSAGAASWGDGPDPAGFDHVVRMLENEFDVVNLPVLINEDDDQPLVLPVSNSPVAIRSVGLDNGDVISDQAKVAELFKLAIANDGLITLHKAQGFDYESDSHFYRLILQLGEDQKTVLVRLYDQQLATSAEPLKLDSYKELQSFSQGQFASDSDYARFETIDIAPGQQNTKGFYVELATDIDASESADNPLQRFNFGGHLNGNNHVIHNLHAPDGLFTIVNYGDLPTYGTGGAVISRGDISTVKHIGFSDLHTQARENLIQDSDSEGFDSQISHLFITGYLKNSLGTRQGTDYQNVLRFGPFRLNRTEMSSVYVNLHHDAEGGYPTSTSNHATVAGLLSYSSLSDIKHTYVNGSVHTIKTALSAKFDCHDSYNNHSDFFYCATAYNTSTHSNGEGIRERNKVTVSMLHGATLEEDYLINRIGQGDEAKFRYVIDRTPEVVARIAGNGRRDGDQHDGIADRFGCDNDLDDGKDACLNIEQYGRYIDDFKLADGWQGGWRTSGRWNISEGEWPVLTDMPYPHTPGARWLLSEDPGVAYQRLTYNDYLQANKPALAALPEPPVFATQMARSLVTGQDVEFKLPSSGGEVLQCYALQPLPAGLTLTIKANSCYLAGSATEEFSSDVITIVALNAGGSSSIDLPLTVLPVLPELVQQAAVVITQGENINVTFTNRGGAIRECRAQPLPGGLTITTNKHACILSGVVDQVMAETQIKIIASNVAGEREVDFSLTVNEAIAAPELSGEQVLDWLQGQRYQARYSSTTGVIENCNVMPALPRGLRLEHQPQENTCVIAGTPLQPQDNRSYRLTASNSGGSNKLDFFLGVQAQAWLGAGPSPYGFDHVAVIRENDFNAAAPAALLTGFAEADLLELNTTGFPNQITRIELDDGQVITDENSLANLFFVNKQNSGNEVYLYPGKSFDFESDSHFYQLTIQLADKTETVLVRLYDVQTGNSNEPLKIHSYDELLSFAQGDLEIDNNLYEILEPVATGPHNTAGFYTELVSDIDASPSADNHFPGFIFKGKLNGNNHVIKDLTLADYFLQSSHSDSAEVKINNLGLVDIRVKNPQSYLLRISDSSRNSYVRNFFISGYVERNIGQPGGPYNGVFYGPLSVSGAHIEQIYLNIQTVLTAGYTSGGQQLVKIAGLANKGAGGAYFDNIYVNGSTKTERQTGAVNLQANCLTSTEGVFWDIGPIYCSQQYKVTPHADLAKNNFGFRRRTPTIVSMLYASTSDYHRVLDTLPQHRHTPLNSSATDRLYRFVSDRNYQDGDIIRTVGNGLRDYINNGTADDVVPEHYQGVPPEQWQGDDYAIYQAAVNNCRPANSCYPMALLGRSEADFKQADGWSGEWRDNGHWDIQDGEWPVLKNMPYPHDTGAAWIDAEDPGVVYQRETYNNYLPE